MLAESLENSDDASIPDRTNASETLDYYFPLLLRLENVWVDGSPEILDFLIYKFYLDPTYLGGPCLANGLRLNYSGYSVMSETDERGNVLNEPTTGRVIDRWRMVRV